MPNKFKLQDILDGKHPGCTSYKLKQKLFSEKIKNNICEECGVGPTWNGKLLNCHLDHVNGISNDHRLENLKILCPNCHSQTITYSGKNIKKENRVSVKKKHDDRASFFAEQKRIHLEQNQEKIVLILKSDIDYNKYGWKSIAASILKITPQKVAWWYKKYLPDIYKNAYSRNVGHKSIGADTGL